MNNQENETQVQMESEFSKLNISGRDSNSVIITIRIVLIAINHSLMNFGAKNVIHLK